MITGIQFSAALTMVGWSRREAAQKCGVSLSTVQRIADAEGVPSSNSDNLHKCIVALESNGITFLADDGNGPGVRYKASNVS